MLDIFQDGVDAETKVEEAQTDDEIQISFQSILRILMMPLFMFLYLFNVSQQDAITAEEEAKEESSNKPLEPIAEEAAAESSGQLVATTSVYVTDEVNLIVLDTSNGSNDLVQEESPVEPEPEENTSEQDKNEQPAEDVACTEIVVELVPQQLWDAYISP